MRLVIIGAGGFGHVIYDIAMESTQYQRIIFLDDNSTDLEVEGKCSEYARYIDCETEFYPALGNNKLRLQWINTLVNQKARVATIIHASAYISRTAMVGTGTVVLQNAVINSHTIVDKGVIVNIGAVIDHNCIIEEGVHICINTVIKANNRIPSLLKIDAGIAVDNNQYS